MWHGNGFLPLWYLSLAVFFVLATEIRACIIRPGIWNWICPMVD
jgi:hypothetical protein